MSDSGDRGGTGPKPMRIVVDGIAALSGGKVYLDHLLPSLADLGSGHEFDVICLPDFDGASAVSHPQFRFHVVRLPSFASSHHLAGSALKMLWRLVFLPSRLERLQPDLLFSNAGFAPARRPAHTRLVLALHNSMPLQGELFSTEAHPLKRLRLFLLRRLLRSTLRNCDALTVFSRDLKQRVVSQIDHLKREPAVVYHGIEWGERERSSTPDPNALARWGVHPPYFLYVSNFHGYKNVVRLIEAFAIVRAARPELSLVLVGEAPDRPYWAEVEEAIARLGLSDGVKHVGGRPREELKEFYRAALGLVYPSLAENCPFAVLEAMAFGLPIAAARASSLPEICGEAAVYFDPYRPEEMARAMESIASSHELRDELSRKAVARATSFSWPEAARQTLHIFEQVGSDRAGDTRHRSEVSA